MKVLTENGYVRFDVEENLSRIYDDFEKAVIEKDRSAYETAVNAFKEEWDISPIQEAAIRIILSDVEVLYKGCENKVIRHWNSAAATNILECIVKNYWHVVNNFFLTEKSRTIKFLDEADDDKFYKKVDGKSEEITVEEFLGIK